jgi:uncharacterized protein (DUF1800 family)
MGMKVGLLKARLGEFSNQRSKAVIYKTIRLITWTGVTLLFSSLAQAANLNSADIVRFLEQSSWGSTETTLQNCQQLGSFESCLRAQFNSPPSRFPVPPAAPQDSNVLCPKGSPASCFRDHYTQYPNQVAFFKNALTGHDQLRQRVAFALHQILVVSGIKIRQPSYMAPYLNILLSDAFSNYRQLLQDITLNPAMGHYLDMVNNDKPSRDGKINPNENYAREVMQLFSIGLFWLNPDGSQILDAQNQPIPTYTQDTVEGFAHVFTGWTYADPSGGTASKFPNHLNFAHPMVLFRDGKGLDQHHDKSAKTLLSLSPNGLPTTLPASQDGQTDLEEALDNLFNHPNVGPFIGKQLIQHLVTSNPSPSYVNRVSNAFNSGKSFGFGSGKRGDMKALIAAILLDEEARGASKTAPDYGHLREPVQFVLNVLRTSNAHSDGILNQITSPMGQNLFYPPTVFSYYPHSYLLPGIMLDAPEYAIDASSQAIARENFINKIVFSQIQPSISSPGTSIDLTALNALSANPADLVNKLDQLYLHGTLTDNMRTQLLIAINAIPVDKPKLRIQTALYLVFASGQYQVQR